MMPGHVFIVAQTSRKQNNVFLRHSTRRRYRRNGSVGYDALMAVDRLTCTT
jgi:hypothetical protein